ncbi:hypothetical protein OZX62_09980 [Bifidobacterium sp. ESL0690]|uniref:hypothetical protein n=1 Tax=Bifidobacterium sp. ESL0690 TaxID=2983214 RepID=UPI0023FA14A8|nr:hypothetical protein [Bifidobacterium sp. ESL0690]WEV46734.1 hypothetical protein OZX62_09980 [Bifidobacterium sp. ESL0690]
MTPNHIADVAHIDIYLRHRLQYGRDISLHELIEKSHDPKGPWSKFHDKNKRHVVIPQKDMRDYASKTPILKSTSYGIPMQDDAEYTPEGIPILERQYDDYEKGPDIDPITLKPIVNEK